MSEKNKPQAQANGKALDDELLTIVSGGCGVCGEDDCNAQLKKNTNEQGKDFDPLNPVKLGSENVQDRYPVRPRIHP